MNGEQQGIRWHYADSARLEAAQALSAALEACNEKPVLLMMSGGSWIDLASMVQVPDKSDITITTLDERFTIEMENSNYSQLMKSELYKQIEAIPHRSIDTRVREGEGHHHHAGRIQTELRAWRALYPEGTVIATLGIGEDGHTAGIFPGVYTEPNFYETFDDPMHLVVSYQVPESINPYTLRTTSTLSLLRLFVDFAIGYAGRGKSEIVNELSKREKKVYEMPAMIFHEMKQVELYTDCKEQSL